MWVQIIGLGLVFLTAIATFLTANRTRKNVAGQIVIHLTEKYSSDDMYSALAIINQYKYFIKEEPIEKIRNSKSFDSLNDARRMISHYFQSIWSLNKIGALNRREMKAVIHKQQLGIFIDVIEIFEKKINPKYDYEPFNGFRRIYKL